VAASGMPSVMTGRSYPCVLSHLAVIATALSVRGRFVLLQSSTMKRSNIAFASETTLTYLVSNTE